MTQYNPRHELLEKIFQLVQIRGRTLYKKARPGFKNCNYRAVMHPFLTLPFISLPVQIIN